MLIAVQGPGQKKSTQVVLGVVGKKNSESFLAGAHWRGVTPNFSLPGQSLLAIMYKFLPKCANSYPGKENVIIIPRWELLARKKVSIFPHRGVPAIKNMII